MITNIAGMSEYVLAQLKHDHFKKPVKVDLSKLDSLIIVPHMGLYVSKDPGDESLYQKLTAYDLTNGDIHIARYSTYQNFILQNFGVKSDMNSEVAKIPVNVSPDLGLVMKTSVIEVSFPYHPQKCSDNLLLMILNYAIAYSILKIQRHNYDCSDSALRALYFNQDYFTLVEILSNEISTAYGRKKMGDVDRVKKQIISIRLKELITYLSKISEFMPPAAHANFYFNAQDPIINAICMFELYDQITLQGICDKKSLLNYLKDRKTSSKLWEVVYSKRPSSLLLNISGVIGEYERSHDLVKDVVHFIKDLTDKDEDPEKTNSSDLLAAFEKSVGIKSTNAETSDPVTVTEESKEEA